MNADKRRLKQRSAFIGVHQRPYGVARLRFFAYYSNFLPILSR